MDDCEVLNNTLSGKDLIRCQGTRNFRTAQPRWWYFAIFDCNSTDGLQFSYKLSMTNGQNENDDKNNDKNGSQNHQAFFLLLIGSSILSIYSLIQALLYDTN